MKVTWTSGLDDSNKAEITALFKANARLRERAVLIMKDKIATAQKRSLSSDAYTNPNWALKQADSVGYERAYQEMIKLFL